MFAAANSILNWSTSMPIRGNAGDGNNNRNNGRASHGMFDFGRNQLEGADDDDDDDDDQYLPSYSDVFVVKTMLGRAGNLPLELVDTIMDHAEYWPHTHVDATSTALGNLTVPSRSFSTSANNLFLCRTVPLGFVKPPGEDNDSASEYGTRRLAPQPLPNPDPAHPGHDAACLPDTIQTWLPAQQPKPVEHPCRKIVFTIVSRDQGWANNREDRGTYRGSYSWFDVGLERYGPAPGPSHEEKGNTCAGAMPPNIQLYSISPAVMETDASLPETQPKSYTYSFPLLPGANRLQSNRVAIREWTKHRIVWSWTDGRGPREANIAADHLVQHGTQSSNDASAGEGATGAARTRPTAAALDSETEEHPLERLGRGSATGDGEFVRNLCIGDVVTVWAKARFPGWVNNVQSIEVDVFWAV